MDEDRERVQWDTRRQRRELVRRVSAWLDLPLALLALAMLGLLLAELALPLSPAWARRVGQTETAIWVVFAAAFVLELVLAPSKAEYLKKNWLTALAVALPALRVVRLLRVAHALRGMSLLRLLTTLNRGTRAIGHVARRGQFGYVILLTAIVTATAAAGAYYLERDEPGANIQTPGDAVWWAATLVTTMNSPYETVTFEGRVVGFLLRVFALGVSGYVTAVIAVYLLGAPRQEKEIKADQAEIRELHREIARLEALIERRLPAPSDGAAALDEPAGLPRARR